MTTLSRLIAAATLIASATLAPGPAGADDRREARGERHERDARPAHVHDRGCGHDLRLAPPAPTPAWASRDDLRWDGRAWVRAGWSHREQDSRHAQARAVRQELLQLERDRDAFHARFPWQRGRLARYDASYLERRADLERELQRLTWYAWR